MQKADARIDVEQKKAVIKKRSQDFMILTADISNMDPLARAAHDMYHAAILQELGLVPPPQTDGNTGGNASAGTGIVDDEDLDMTQPGAGYVPSAEDV